MQGIDKKEIIEGLGFESNRAGNLVLDGREVKTIDDSAVNVKANDVKAILSESLKVITDISEMELLFQQD